MDHILFCTGHELKIPNIANSDGLYLYDDPENGLAINIMTSAPILSLLVKELETGTL